MGLVVTGDLTSYGFVWGPVEVQRAAEFPRSGGVARVIRLLDHENAQELLEIYVSPKGKSVRVFRKGKELR